MRRINVLCGLCLTGILFAGCSGLNDLKHNTGSGGNSGGSSGSGGNTGSGGAVSVSVSPSTVTVSPFGTQNFSANVTGTTNTAVTWAVNGVAGGSATTGTISASGVFTAPTSVSPALVPANSPTAALTVTATSAASAAASGSAAVTLLTQEQAPQHSPVKLGTSGGNINDTNGPNCCSGTLGSLITLNGTQYILSNNHVLAKSDKGIAGDPISQPGLVDTNCSTTGTQTVAHLSQFFNLETGPVPKIDAALAQTVSGTVDTGGNILLLGATVTNGVPDPGAPHAGPLVTPSVGQSVAKSGRTTGLTCSSVLALNVMASVDYYNSCGDTTPAFTVNYTDLISVNGGDFSGSGDSGSLIVTQDTADPIALLFAGSDTDTVGNPISDVLSAFPGTGNTMPTFVGGAAHQVIGCTLPPASRVTEPQVQVAVGSTAIRNALRARDLHAPDLLANPAVAALGIGKDYDHPGQAAVLLFVAPGESRASLPRSLEGVPTRLVEGVEWPIRGVLNQQETAQSLQSVGEPPIVSALLSGELQRARTVQQAHGTDLLKLPSVIGVGITSSVNAPGEAALIIYVLHGASQDSIPLMVDGLRTRVRESDRFTTGNHGNERVSGCRVPSAKPAMAVSKN